MDGSSTQPLVWVNKTAASDALSNSRSDQQHNFSIYSQAQRYSRVRRKLHQRWIPVAGKRLQPQTNRVRERKPGLPTRDTSLSQENPDLYEIFSNSIIQGQEIPRSPSGGGSADPFHTLPVKLDSQVYSMLHYSITHFCPDVGEAPLGQAHILSNLRLQFAAHRVQQHCMTTDVCLTSLLAHMASRMEHLEGYKLKGGTTHFMHLALSTLRKSLDDATKDPTWIHFYATYNLFMAEAYRRDFEGALTHLHAASHLGDRIGGFRALWQHLAETLIGGVLFYLYLAMKPHCRELPTLCDPGRAGEVLSEEHYIFLIDPLLSSCGRALLSRSFEEVISPEMKPIIEDVIEYTQIYHNAWIQIKIQPIVLQWLRVRSLALRHRLLSVNILDDRLDAIRITIATWLTSLISHSGWQGNLDMACSHLKEILLRIKDWHWDRHSEAQIWMLMIGSVSSSQSDFFVQRLATFIRDEDPAKCQMQLQKISSHFFFLDSYQKASLKDLASKLALSEKAKKDSNAEIENYPEQHELIKSSWAQSEASSRSAYELCEMGFW